MRFFKAASGERARAWDYASTEAQARRAHVDPIADLDRRLGITPPTGGKP